MTKMFRNTAKHGAESQITDIEKFEREYRELLGEPIAKASDIHDLSQPDPRPNVFSVTTYGAYETPVVGRIIVD